MRNFVAVSCAKRAVEKRNAAATSRRAGIIAASCGFDYNAEELGGAPTVSVQVLKNPGRAHASANAHGDHSIACISALQLADYRGRELRTRASQGMAKRDRPTVGINLFRIKPANLHDRQRLRGK